jgi:hypothetical protein
MSPVALLHYVVVNTTLNNINICIPPHASTTDILSILRHTCPEGGIRSIPNASIKTCVEAVCKTYNERSSPILFLIALEHIHIERIEASCNVIIFAKQVTFADNACIHLNAYPHTPFIHHSFKYMQNMTGLSGYPGVEGSNCAIFCDNSINVLPRFESDGGQGYPGQEGNPGGHGGPGGYGGKLFINGNCVAQGVQGKDGFSYGNNMYPERMPLINDLGVNPIPIGPLALIIRKQLQHRRPDNPPARVFKEIFAS